MVVPNLCFENSDCNMLEMAQRCDLQVNGMGKLKKVFLSNAESSDLAKKNFFKKEMLKITDYQLLDIDMLSKKEIEEYIKTQPITCTIDLYPSFRRHTEQGVYMDTEKEVERFQKLFDEGKNNTAHAMLIVGYGMENGEEFFLVQNSWGTKWGYYGFAKIKRSLLYYLQYPLIH
ncbi:hypothetical protein CQW23_28231 [Capsicum baccatum]|uniref:Peptidase C1A papain C-terminal domain-containing protein n=1 Tax=Capsicum baccatum TaxID=33114 RepID=A0A2G2VFY5_CAPBA|nr:hypothetical protein CQW23_28231 [Capsicum baccatum]